MTKPQNPQLSQSTAERPAIRDCSTCRHGSVIDKAQGYCRRFPPVLRTDGISSSFPPVKLEWSCGEWAMIWENRPTQSKVNG